MCAERFSSLIEHGGPSSPREFAAAIHVALADLYAAGLKLPPLLIADEEDGPEDAEDEVTAEDVQDPDRLNAEAWLETYQAIGRRLPGSELYLEVFDPFDWSDDQPVIGNLADDLADVYGEIRPGLTKWQRGEHSEAAWYWRFAMETHWAEHATGALRALQSAAFTYDYDPPAPPTTEA